ncbi:terminase large subunit domain-containing protein [Desulfoferula mesophila]|uniref:Terminase large subunit-like ATPase domain-containing protein n=1 Tax=Desulfoferula mesophila TaxID=3058419 RepID=A0AAU9EBM8_9BACT|nr:hypothetical protein FAK_15640 [Desulfoferula mesophilus]
MQRIPIDRFAEALFVLDDGRPMCLEDWQRERVFEPVFDTMDDRGLRQFNEALIGLPKKNSKSTMAALVACYGLLADGEPEPEIYGVAGDKDQARVIFRQTSRAIQRSPVLLNEVRIYKDVIERKDGTGFYRVLSADAPTAHGLNPHFVIFDELWNQRSYDLYEALTHSPVRRQPLHFIVTYAGYEQYEGNLLWDLYQRGLRGDDPRFYFIWSHENLASWITAEYLEQQRRRLPEHVFQRLHENRWTSGSSAFLPRDDVDLAITPRLGQTWAPGGGHAFSVGVDLGLANDATVVTTVHYDRDSGKVVLDNVKTWRGSKLQKVRIEDVEDHLMNLHENFPGVRVSADPWQAVNSIQRLKERGLKVEEFVFSPSNITRLTQNLFSLFKDRRIEIFDYPDLIKELVSVKVVEKSYGYRIDHESGAHDDHVISLGMAALAAVSKAQRKIRARWLDGDDELPAAFSRASGGF